MNLINQSAFLKALGWSLLDSLWQMALMWLVYVCLTANGRKFQARQRHTIALLSLMGGSTWFLFTLVLHFYNAVAAPQVVTVFLSAKELIETRPALLASLATGLEPMLPYLSVAYLAVACFLFLRFYRQYYHTRRLYTTGLQKAHPEWRVFLGQALQHMGIKKKVTIWFSSLVDTPLTLGFWKPVILLPVAAVNHLSIQQAEAIILHELNHIRRSDYLINLLIACTDIILFFNPFSRFLTGIIRKERENSCDDLVLQFRYDAQSYAKALLTLEQNRTCAATSLALAATGKNQQFLLNRVKRILTKENTTTPIPQRMLAFLLSAVLIGFIGLYNPAKVIIRTIDDVTVRAANTEMPKSFETPPSAELAATTPPPALEEVKVEKRKHEKHAEDNSIEQFEDLIELAADVKLAAIAEQFENFTESPQMNAFVSTWETVDFSMQPAVQTAPLTEVQGQVYPFVPSSSLIYQVMEDTALPKKYVLSLKELKTKDAVEKALLTMQVIDWKKLEKELNAAGNKIDIAKLQKEIEKAIMEVDWKKVDEEKQAEMIDAETAETKARESYVVQLGNYQQARARRQEEIKKAQQQVLLDRLEQHKRLQTTETKKTCNGTKGTVVKKKKIIDI